MNPQRPSLDLFTAELRALLMLEDASLRSNSNLNERARSAFWGAMSAGASAFMAGVPHIADAMADAMARMKEHCDVFCSGPAGLRQETGPILKMVCATVPASLAALGDKVAAMREVLQVRSNI